MHLMNTATSVLSAPYFRLECVQQLRKNAELLHISNFFKLNIIFCFHFIWVVLDILRNGS